MVVRFLVSALALGLATWLLPGITLEDGPLANQIVTIVVVAAIFGLVNSLVRPLFGFVISPLLLVALGAFLLVVNAALLLFTSWVCTQFGIGWHVSGFWSAVLGALLVSVVSFVLNSVVGRRDVEHR